MDRVSNPRADETGRHEQIMTAMTTTDYLINAVFATVT